MASPAIDPGTLHVSFSQLNTYLLCPERFKQAYVRGRTPSHRSGNLVFGSAIHEALAWYHEQLSVGTARPAASDLIRAFEEKVLAAPQGRIPIMWDDEDTVERLLTTGRELLRLYHTTATPYRVLAVERPFHLPRVDAQTGSAQEEILTGVVDLIEQDADGTVYVTELKTAARRFDDTRLRFDHQMSIYAAARAELGVPNARVRFRVLLKAKKPSIETYEIRRDDYQLAETNRVIDQVLQAVNVGIFYPIRGWQCAACPYRSACGT